MSNKTAYLSSLRDIQFVLWEQFNLEAHLQGSRETTEVGKDTVNEVLVAAEKFSTLLGESYVTADREGCKLVEGKVVLPSPFSELWRLYTSAKWPLLGIPKKHQGMALPYIVSQSVNEMFMGANPSFMNYSGFCAPVYHLIELYGSEYLKSKFGPHLAQANWSACFCMTEPQAGTDIGLIETSARQQEGPRYEIKGRKIFISAGMQELTENIAYLVVARTGEEHSGTRGLSCFIVPRFSEETGEDNNVRCVSLESKMGLHACVTAELSFGADGPCTGYLLGEKENQAMVQLLPMMNMARIATAVYANGLASSAYQHAVRYAKQRKQGTAVRKALNPRAERLSIVNHVDVKRMLLEMKSKVEGIRALITKLSLHVSERDRIQRSETGLLNEISALQLKEHGAYIDLLTPVAKAYSTDQAWRIAELSIQVHGGVGYLSDYVVEQYARDVKVMSIWEGTNYVQSADLVREKLCMGRPSAILDIYERDLILFLTESRQRSENSESTANFEREIWQLEDARQAFSETHKFLGSLLKEKKMEVIFGVSTRVLEMLAEITVAWLLLEAALIAVDNLKGELTISEKNFYTGKIASARFYINNVLPNVRKNQYLISRNEFDMTAVSEDVF